jgi:hypothetical protein
LRSREKKKKKRDKVEIFPFLTASARTDIFPLKSLFSAQRETSMPPISKLEKGRGGREGSEDEEEGDEEEGATMGAPKSSKFCSSPESGSIIVRGSTKTGSVSASCGVGGIWALSPSSGAAETAIDERKGEWRRRADGEDFDVVVDEDQEEEVERRDASLVMSLRAMSVVLVAAPAAEEEWLGPARACVVDRITENWLVARERGAREGKREREKKSRRRNESTL